MTIYLYPGYVPSNVSKDAKYTIKRASGKWVVHLTYTLNRSQQALLTTESHPELVAMVNRAKKETVGEEGGSFYINEYGHVVVPTPAGALYAGTYNSELKFSFGDSVIGPSAPAGLQPGDEWPGPHVGIQYTLAAGGNDIKFKWKPEPNIEETVSLAQEHGARAAKKLANRLAAIKGSQGGRIYINEQCEFFAPHSESTGMPFVYLGHLDDDAWFVEFDVSGYEGE